MKKFQPMLAGKCSDIETLKYPVLASLKLDGVRCLVIDGVLVSRNLKPIPNVQNVFGRLPDGTDGELIVGDPTAPDAYRKTVSAVMGEGNDTTRLVYYVFDNYEYAGDFENRMELALKRKEYQQKGVQVLAHRVCHNTEELAAFESEAVEAGHEGIMVRSFDGPYKFGRSTEKEGYLLKIKRFEDAEAIIIGTEEYMHNTNEAKKNALGHTERSTKKEGLVGASVLGKLLVKGVGGTYDGVKFEIGTGFQGAALKDGERDKLWKIRDSLIGKLVKFKYFPLGSKDRPRFPVFLGFRSSIDA